jgi:putative glycosyltransferase (TIGR04348 family)
MTFFYTGHEFYASFAHNQSHRRGKLKQRYRTDMIAGMNIAIVTPAPPGSLHGNRGTALRWADILQQLGHSVSVEQEIHSGDADVMVALHARRSASSICAFRERFPSRPLIVALTGTDLYGDVPAADADAIKSLHQASRLVVLHELPPGALPEEFNHKVRVLHQSMPARLREDIRDEDRFDVCVAGHLREVKDPFRAAEATTGLPESSRISIFHLGGAMSAEMERLAKHHEARNARYHWLGELLRNEALDRMAGCQLMVISSIMEGGPTVLTEALAMQLPVLVSDVPGHVGILGASYPGYFAVGDTESLRSLLLKAESDATYYESLLEGVRTRSHLADPARELAAWRELLDEFDEFPS